MPLDSLCFPALVAAVFGGGALLWIGVRYIARAGRPLFKDCAIANLTGMLAGGALAWSIATAIGNLSSLSMVGWLLGGVAGLMPCWAITKSNFRIPWTKAALAWVPTMVAVSLLVLWMPKITYTPEQVRLAECQRRLELIGRALEIYAKASGGEFPPSLEALVSSRADPKLDSATITCPGVKDHKQCDYFYFPLAARNDANEVIACDTRGNHRESRNVLFASRQVVNLLEDGFQSTLADPNRAAFAKALRAAEGPRQ